MDRGSIKAIKMYSKYGVIIFYLYVLLSKMTKSILRQSKEDYGWKFDFSFGQAPHKIQVREIKSQFHNLSNSDFDDSRVKEDIYPMS